MQIEREGSQDSPNRKIVRRRGACDNCKQRKIRCDGTTPTCSPCQKQDMSCTYTDSKKRRSLAQKRSSLPQSVAFRSPIPEARTSTSVDHQFLDTYDVDTDPDLFSLPISAFEHEALSNMPPLDLLPFGQEVDVTGEDVYAEHKSSPSQAGHPSSPIQMISPLESLFPPPKLPWKHGLPESITPEQGENIYNNESSTLASIMLSNLHNISESPNGPSIRSLLEDVAKKALDVSYTATHCSKAIDKQTQRPLYIRHDIVGYADAYFEHYHECLPFLKKDQFNCLLNEFLAHQLPDGSPAGPLVNSVLALGCRLVVQLKSQDGGLADQEARRYHLAALAARVDLISMQPAILNIQALFAMALYYPCIQSSPIAISLICTAAQHCLTLKLDRINSIRALATSEEDCQLMQRIFWVVYSFEKPLALRLGRSSSIDDDFIDHSPRAIERHPEQPDSTRPEPFICLCEYAKLCSMILKQLYSNNRSKVPRSDFESTLYSLDQLLQAWKRSALDQVDSVSSELPTSNLSSEQHSDVLLKHHELRVTIYHRGEPCIESAREVLAQSHRWNPNLSYSNWQIVRIPIMACCVLLIDVFSNPRSDVFRNNLAFLGMAGGWLGRLATTTTNCVPFDELMELIALAQQQRRV